MLEGSMILLDFTEISILGKFLIKYMVSLNLNNKFI